MINCVYSQDWKKLFYLLEENPLSVLSNLKFQIWIYCINSRTSHLCRSTHL